MNAQTLSMDEPKKKLARLEEVDGFRPRLCDFGRYLVVYLDHQFVGHLGQESAANSFVLCCELAICDLERGVNGFTGKPIQNKLVGPAAAVFRMDIPRIADAILSPEFAASVKACLKEIRESHS